MAITLSQSTTQSSQVSNSWQVNQIPQVSDLSQVSEPAIPMAKWNDEDCYFVTIRARYFDFTLNIYYRSVLRNLRESKKMFDLNLYSFIIMPNHVHLLMSLKQECNLSKIMHYLKRHSSRQMNGTLTSQLQAQTPQFPIQVSQFPSQVSQFPSQVSQVRQPVIAQVQPVISTAQPVIATVQPMITQACEESPELFRWIPRFYERRIRDERDFNNVIDYINIKNLNDLQEKYGYKGSIEDYPFYTYTNPDLIDEY